MDRQMSIGEVLFIRDGREKLSCKACMVSRFWFLVSVVPIAGKDRIQKRKRFFGFSFLSDQLDRPNARFWLSKISFQKRVFVDDIFHPVWWEKIKSKTKTRFCFTFLLDRLDRPYSGVGLSLIFPHKFGNDYHDFVLKEYSWAKSRIIENLRNNGWFTFSRYTLAFPYGNIGPNHAYLLNYGVLECTP